MTNPAPSRRGNAVLVALALVGLLGTGVLVGTLLVPAADPASLALQPAAPIDDLLGAVPVQPGALLPEPDTPLATPPALLVVYITGAVEQPDVYVLPAAARIKDAVLAAGGLTPDADSERINLAAYVADAQHIHVPRVGDATASLPGGAAASGGSVAPPGNNGGPAPLININTASVAELTALPGIGSVLAQRIVDYRRANGPFATIDALQDVPGIGASLLSQIRPLVRVDEEAGAAPARP